MSSSNDSSASTLEGPAPRLRFGLGPYLESSLRASALRDCGPRKYGLDQQWVQRQLGKRSRGALENAEEEEEEEDGPQQKRRCSRAAKENEAPNDGSQGRPPQEVVEEAEADADLSGEKEADSGGAINEGAASEEREQRGRELAELGGEQRGVRDDGQAEGPARTEDAGQDGKLSDDISGGDDDLAEQEQQGGGTGQPSIKGGRTAAKRARGFFRSGAEAAAFAAEREKGKENTSRNESRERRVDAPRAGCDEEDAGQASKRAHHHGAEDEPAGKAAPEEDPGGEEDVDFGGSGGGDVLQQDEGDVSDEEREDNKHQLTPGESRSGPHADTAPDHEQQRAAGQFSEQLPSQPTTQPSTQHSAQLSTQQASESAATGTTTGGTDNTGKGEAHDGADAVPEEDEEGDDEPKVGVAIPNRGNDVNSNDLDEGAVELEEAKINDDANEETAGRRPVRECRKKTPYNDGAEVEEDDGNDMPVTLTVGGELALTESAAELVKSCMRLARSSSKQSTLALKHDEQRSSARKPKRAPKRTGASAESEGWTLKQCFTEERIRLGTAMCSAPGCPYAAFGLWKIRGKRNGVLACFDHTRSDHGGIPEENSRPTSFPKALGKELRTTYLTKCTADPETTGRELDLLCLPEMTKYQLKMHNATSPGRTVLRDKKLDYYLNRPGGVKDLKGIAVVCALRSNGISTNGHAREQKQRLSDWLDGKEVPKGGTRSQLAKELYDTGRGGIASKNAAKITARGGKTLPDIVIDCFRETGIIVDNKMGFDWVPEDHEFSYLFQLGLKLGIDPINGGRVASLAVRYLAGMNLCVCFFDAEENRIHSVEGIKGWDRMPFMVKHVAIKAEWEESPPKMGFAFAAMEDDEIRGLGEDPCNMRRK